MCSWEGKLIIYMGHLQMNLGILPNYFMQYKSIEFAKNNGVLSYDWGGITGRER